MSIGLLVAGIALLGVAMVMSATSMQAIGYIDDPPIQCGSLFAPHHFPDATYSGVEAEALANRKCGGARAKRTHRVYVVGLAGLALGAGALVTRRRDAMIAAAARAEYEQRLATTSSNAPNL